ncbi:hypothetical protein [Lignipirellula cremea]|uniref:Uncharacterized protein n=1 Tax=Lignipirellula cremea TaxID=2528010 RepID=A0A518DLS7_9BACT|nr:hypothetical protein [Lignipirellula cremea]QDU92794.1 hypothetical protein Pla8534_05670 [Lignipirellula cremea]
MLNPYQTPVPDGVRPVRRRKASLLRGIAAGLLLAAFGYVVAVGAIAALAMARNVELRTFHGLSQFLLNVWSRSSFRDLLFPPCFGCELVLGLSGLVNYTPDKFPGLLRTMIRVGGATILGVIFMVIMTNLFDLGPRTYTSDPFEFGRLAMAALFPALYAAASVFFSLGESADPPTPGDSSRSAQ